MAALPVIGAGVSIVQGISGIAARNKQAAAEREQREIQARQSVARTEASLLELYNQQQQRENNAAIADFQRQQAMRQEQFGYQLQDAIIKANAATAQAQLNQQAVAADISGMQQLQQIERQRANTITQTENRQQAASTKVAQAGEQAQAGGREVDQLINKSTAELAVQQARMASRSKSSRNYINSERRQLLQQALAAGLNIDRQVAEQQVQSLSEEQLAQLEQQVGLNDANANLLSVASNIRAIDILQQSRQDQLNVNTNQQLVGNQLLAQQSEAASKVEELSLASSREAERQSYDIAQGNISQSGKTTVEGLQTLNNNTKGASLLDIAAVGINGYVGIKSATGGSPSTQANTGGLPIDPVTDTSKDPAPPGSFLQSGGYANNSNVG